MPFAFSAAVAAAIMPAAHESENWAWVVSLDFARLQELRCILCTCHIRQITLRIEASSWPNVETTVFLV